VLIARLRQLVPALWAGSLLCVALIAAPAAFATLSPAEAGRVVGRLFAQEAYVSLAAALLFVMLDRKHGGAVFGANLLFALGALFCTVAGYFALQPMMAASRAGQGSWTFGQLHAVSLAFFAVKALLVCALAWRTTSRSS
jgi:hypothetical protein